MKLILRSPFFMMAAALIIIQQVFVAASSFSIAAAGEAVARGEFSIVPELIRFFGTIVLAYIFGATAQWLTVLLANNAWKNYYEGLLAKIGSDSALSSEKNKSLTNTWISGEALSTFETSGLFFVDFIGIYCNIGFTLFTFYELLGLHLTLAIGAGLGVSILIIQIARPAIEKLAFKIQDGKVQALVAVQLLWDHRFYGNSRTSAAAEAASQRLVTQFTSLSSRYKATEQIIACTPVLLSIPLVIWVISSDLSAHRIAVGALVALLPRTLQLFQNLHAALSYAGQFLLFKSKLRNLDGFVARLERHELEANVSIARLNVRDGRSTVEVDSLLGEVTGRSGRLTITGPNGAGKSTLLKVIKSRNANAVLLGPGIQVVETAPGSTGQKQLYSIGELIRQSTPVLLLDEWDANLDKTNAAAIDARLDEYANDFLVIEVRHSR